MRGAHLDCRGTACHTRFLVLYIILPSSQNHTSVITLLEKAADAQRPSQSSGQPGARLYPLTTRLYCLLWAGKSSAMPAKTQGLKTEQQDVSC